MAACEQVAFQPALTGVFAEDFHHMAIFGQMIVIRFSFRIPGPVGDIQNGVQAVGIVFIRGQHTEVPFVQIGRHDVF